MKLPGWLTSAAFIVGAAVFVLGVGDLEFGHQLGRDLAVGFIERGAEIAAGASLFAAGVKVPSPPA
jgi:hypothetical protein